MNESSQVKGTWCCQTIRRIERNEISCGDISVLYYGHMPIVVIASPQLVVELGMTKTKPHEFYNRAQPPYEQEALLLAHDHNWKARKNTISPIFAAHRIAQAWFHQTMANTIQRFGRAVDELGCEETKSEGQVPSSFSSAPVSSSTPSSTRPHGMVDLYHLLCNMMLHEIVHHSVSVKLSSPEPSSTSTSTIHEPHEGNNFGNSVDANAFVSLAPKMSVLGPVAVIRSVFPWILPPVLLLGWKEFQKTSQQYKTVEGLMIKAYQACKQQQQTQTQTQTQTTNNKHKQQTTNTNNKQQTTNNKQTNNKQTNTNKHKQTQTNTNQQ